MCFRGRCRPRGAWAVGGRARLAGMLSGERCGGAGGLAMSRPGDGGKSSRARRRARIHKLVREKRRAQRRGREPSCGAVEVYCMGMAVLVIGALDYATDSGAACTR